MHEKCNDSTTGSFFPLRQGCKELFYCLTLLVKQYLVESYILVIVYIIVDTQ